MDQSDNGVTVAVTGGNGAVMVVERLGEERLLTALLPPLLAMAEHGLRGDGRAVYDALGRLVLDLRQGRLELPAGALVAERLELLRERFRDRAPADEQDGRPSRVDVLRSLLTIGAIGEAEHRAGLDIRRAAELAERAAHGVRAVDPARPVVDGGPGWSMPECWGAGAASSPLVGRVLAWARYVAGQDVELAGRRGRATALELVHRVTVANIPLREVDRALGARKGEAGRIVKAALTLYASMHEGT